MIKEEKYLTMNVLRDNIVGKNALGNSLRFPDDYGK